MRKLFRFRDKNEKLGILLGCICFIPSFVIAFALSMFESLVLGLTVMLLSQCLWLTSISLCCRSLEIENERLKEKLKED